jgi:serine/threonine protein kinase/tetratricopeptide (TPR) repeat protein
MSSEQGGGRPEQWELVKAVFGAVLERAPAERAAFLEATCSGDAEVRREVESLLEAHRVSDSFLETPAAAVGGPGVVKGAHLSEGQTVGTYRVLRPLGRGGMATVYLAHDLRHRRSVALKVLHPELGHAVGPERFLREIDVAAKLSHPHILPLFDSGEVDGLLYYAMPYVEGESLRDRLQRETQLPVDEALQIAREVADALNYAHGQGVIHRDIKPENILLSGDHALVADFGIARVLGSGGNERLTETGMAVGTVAYMSPEQASGTQRIDGRSDVYSLGCVLYEMLAGEPPYTGPSAQAIITKRLSDPVPSARRLRRTIPVAVDRIVAKALAPVPADRFATIAQLATSLHSSGTQLDDATSLSQAPVAGENLRSSAIKTWARRRMPLAAALLGLGFLIGLGVLFGSRRSASSGADPAPAGPKRVAVLPFENMGGPDAEYFADGITEAIRGKLTSLPDLQVTARASSNQYKKSSELPKQIGQELGVQYLLTGTVRWAKRSDGTSRVQVTPQLIQVSNGAAQWQQPFDAAMSDVFQVQGEIAERVAQTLGVALGSEAREQLEEKATQNLAAYDAYMQGEASGVLADADPATMRRAIRHYERAVALDSTFAPAWARLAQAQGLLYVALPSTNLETSTRSAAERAVALSPNRPEGRLALGIYYGAVARDPRRAAEQLALGLRIAPNDPELLTGNAQIGWALGRWDEALKYLRRAATLDPRSVNTSQKLGQGLLWMRRYPEARAALEHALALAPDNINTLEMRAMVELAQGDLGSARAVLRSAPEQVEPIALAAFMAATWDLGWLLPESGQRLMLEASPEAFGDDRLTWALVEAQLYALRGDRGRARAYADTAQSALAEALRTAPDDGQLHTLRGLALGYLGRQDEAVREGRRGLELLPISHDAYYGPYIQHQLARIYILVGEQEKALDQLEPLLQIPYYLSPGWLRIDPNFAPLRGNPRFERLVNARP